MLVARSQAYGLLTSIRMLENQPRLAVLTAIHKLGPTTARDVATATERSTATVWHHVKSLGDEGLVTWEPGKARTLRTTDAGTALFP